VNASLLLADRNGNENFVEEKDYQFECKESGGADRVWLQRSLFRFSLTKSLELGHWKLSAVRYAFFIDFEGSIDL
jgi:hypothetical protein